MDNYTSIARPTGAQCAHLQSLPTTTVLSAPVPSWALAAGVCLILTAFYLFNRNKHSYWSRKGVGGPRPWPIAGNIPELVLGDTLASQLAWTRNYGKIHGIYEGYKPTLVVADAELIRQLCVKDFDVFPDHDFFREIGNKYQQSFIFFLKGDHWKRVRALLSPTFTSGKIKRMFKLMDECADELIATLEAETDHKPSSSSSSNVVNIKDIYCLYSLDAMASSCYSMRLDVAQRQAHSLGEASQKSEFVRATMDILEFRTLRFLVGFILPTKLLQAVGYKVVPESVMSPIVKRVESIIQHRKASMQGKRLDDYLQLLLDARLEDKLDDLQPTDANESHHIGMTNKNSEAESQENLVREVRQALINGSSGDTKLNNEWSASGTTLSETEILSGATLMMIVGLEATANLLTNSTYILAFQQSVQDKLHEELNKIATYEDHNKNSPRFSYDDLSNCQYLDMVMSECMRHLSPIVFMDRKAVRDYHVIKYDLHLTKGTRLLISNHSVHHNPDYWQEPSKFDPMRFAPNRRDQIVPGSYIPFGVGPRHCFAMRFSLAEAKLALSRIVMQFKLEPAPGTSYPTAMGANIGLICPEKPLVRLVKRCKQQ